jgi:hypothetical protein
VRLQLYCWNGDRKHRSPNRFQHLDGDDPVKGAFPAFGEAAIVSKSMAVNLRRRNRYEAEWSRLDSTYAR